MRRSAKIVAVAVLALSIVTGCEEEELEPWDDPREEPAEPREDAGDPQWSGDDDDLRQEQDAGVRGDAAPRGDDGPGDGRAPDAGDDTRTDSGAPDADSGIQNPSTPIESPRTEVPDELIGAWDTGAFDFATWENYREGQWAGRNATPSREAMVFSKNGEAKFYRYEFAFTLYEELIDCEGTVTFGDDGTFTFYPARGRKRFHDFTHSERSVDRALTPAELIAPKLAGKRAYVYDPSDPSKVQIRVPSSAPYNWYRKE